MDSIDIKKMAAASAEFILLLTVIYGAAGSTRVAAGQVPQRPSLTFSGTVKIGGQPIDPGRGTVEIRIFNAARQFKVCGKAPVRLVAISSTVGSSVYDVTLNSQDTDCLNPSDRYDFYVNGVWAANEPYVANETAASVVNLNVPEVALVSPAGDHLVWFSGVVTDSLARPAPSGVKVTATSMDSTCPASGTGTTQNLYWAPKVEPSRPVGVNGFYWIGIAFDDRCADRQIYFKFELAGTVISQQVPVTTPPYGRALSVPPLVLPVRR
jgi:hypothetical protein